MTNEDAKIPITRCKLQWPKTLRGAVDAGLTDEIEAEIGDLLVMTVKRGETETVTVTAIITGMTTEGGTRKTSPVTRSPRKSPKNEKNEQKNLNPVKPPQRAASPLLRLRPKPSRKTITGK